MCVNRGANGELGHLQGHPNNAFNVLNEDFPRHIERTTGPSFDKTSPVVLVGVALTEMISSGSVLIVEAKNFKVRRQLSMNLSVSMLVKKPARSWL